MKKLAVLLIIICFASQAFADFSLPSTRSITWQGNVGVSGGIPTRETIYTTIAATSGDRTSTIQTALNNCPSGQVVLLGAGSFTFSTLSMRSNCTLRGSGVGITTIVPTSSEFIQFGPYGTGYGTAVGITDGLSKGSTSITTASNHGWSAGDYIVIDQLNNTDGDPIITSVGDGGNFNMGGRTGDGARACQQVVKLVAPTSGTTATLELPLYWTVDATRTPQAAEVTMVVENAGIESLTIDNTANLQYSITMFNAANCWVYDVELNGTGNAGYGIYLAASYRNTIAHNILHQEDGGAMSDNYMIISGGTGSANLIENNLIYNVTNGIVFQGGMSGSVIAYNYITNLNQTAFPTANRYGMGFHGGHSIQNLFEGNVIDGGFFASDNYWGSNSHNTLFRNRVVMNYEKVDQQITLGIAPNQTYYNVIGNYIGTAATETGYEVRGAVYDPSLEYAYSTGAGASYGAERSTMLRHANYDGYTQAQKWCDSSGEPGCQEGSTDHTLPNSLYLAAKPAWYVGTWPPVNPVTPSLATIPAQYYYDNDAWPTEDVTEYTLTVTLAGTGVGTVTSSPAGINCGATCTYDFEDDTEVTLTATPTGSDVFAGWSGTGGCTGTSTCVLTMTAAKAATATFNLPVTVSTKTMSGGSASGGTMK